MRYFVITLSMTLAASVAASTPAGAQETAGKLPAGVTQEMISQGASVFTGAGICAACHGPEAKGIPNLGADLTDDKWVHSDGSYEGILETIKNGVAPAKSTTGAAMPPKGGSNISEEQMKSVAAYVWRLWNRK